MTRMVSTSGDLALNIAASRCETENGPAENRRDLQIRCPQSPQPESTDVRYHPETLKMFLWRSTISLRLKE